VYACSILLIAISSTHCRCLKKLGREPDHPLSHKIGSIRLGSARLGSGKFGSGSVGSASNRFRSEQRDFERRASEHEACQREIAAVRAAEEDILASRPLRRAWETLPFTLPFESPSRPSSRQAWATSGSLAANGFPLAVANTPLPASSADGLVRHVLTELVRVQGLAQFLDDEPATAGMATAGPSQIELSFECRDLCNRDFGSLSDPCCVICAELESTLGYQEIGRTETINDTLSPRWAKTVTLPYTQGCVVKLRLMVYDIDNETATLEDDDLLGSVECTLDQIVGQRVLTAPRQKFFRLTGPPTSAPRVWGTMIVHAVAQGSRSLSKPSAAEADRVLDLMHEESDRVVHLMHDSQPLCTPLPMATAQGEFLDIAPSRRPLRPSLEQSRAGTPAHPGIDSGKAPATVPDSPSRTCIVDVD
jgi:hypothetical protein